MGILVYYQFIDSIHRIDYNSKAVVTNLSLICCEGDESIDKYNLDNRGKLRDRA